MKQDYRAFFAVKTNQWKIYLQQLMHCYSMQGEQPIKQVSWDECDKKWSPVWNSQPIASSACLELVMCGCKSEKGCDSRCSCKKDALNYASVVNTVFY